MDRTQFDGIVRSLTSPASRRGVLGGLLGAILGVAAAARVDSDDVSAKKRGKGKGKGRGRGRGSGRGGSGEQKVLICHKGQEIVVGAPAVDAHVRNHGDTIGPCPPPNPCAGRPDDDPCAPAGGGTGACCGGLCTRLNTLQHCTRCGDVCPAPSDTCAALGSGGDPASGCCAPVGTVCTAAADRCCNASTCTGTFNGQTVCCGISGASSCTVGTQCCSGTCDLAVNGGTCA